jgi:hypothetical protein
MNSPRKGAIHLRSQSEMDLFKRRPLMKAYESLFKQYKEQPSDAVFAHFYPINFDYDRPFVIVAEQTIDGLDAWNFHQPRFTAKYPAAVPKLRNYLNYTFVRLLELERCHPGKFFKFSATSEWVCFNTGLQNQQGSDLLAVFQIYKPRSSGPTKAYPDWVFKGCWPPNEHRYRAQFGTDVPDIAWYSTDSRDFVFDSSYQLDRDAFDHVFERAKERAGLPTVSDEVVRNYLRGAIENLIPKIKRNYKVAIPVYYVQEKRMQLLLPFVSASNSADVSCFLVEREDRTKTYRLKTIFDLDQAYYSARLITRPDKDWLDP